MFKTPDKHRAGKPRALASALGFMLALPLVCLAGDPVASYTIKYSNNFDSNMNGIYRSPSDLPADRVMLTQDPLGQRHGVLKITWKAGDDYRTSSNTSPRSWASCHAFYFQGGQTVSCAWGFYSPNPGIINANIAQNISNGGPCWELQIVKGGDIWMAANGRTSCNFNMPTGRWTDFKTEFNLQSSNTGWLKLYINGSQKYYKSSLGFGSTKASTTNANCHFDYGIYGYLYDSSAPPTRVLYASNLSIGKK